MKRACAVLCLGVWVLSCRAQPEKAHQNTKGEPVSEKHTFDKVFPLATGGAYVVGSHEVGHAIFFLSQSKAVRIGKIRDSILSPKIYPLPDGSAYLVRNLTAGALTEPEVFLLRASNAEPILGIEGSVQMAEIYTLADNSAYLVEIGERRLFYLKGNQAVRVPKALAAGYEIYPLATGGAYVLGGTPAVCFLYQSTLEPVRGIEGGPTLDDEVYPLSDGTAYLHQYSGGLYHLKGTQAEPVQDVAKISDAGSIDKPRVDPFLWSLLQAQRIRAEKAAKTPDEPPGDK